MLNPLVRAPQPTDLSAPVGTVMRPTLTVERGDSLARGAQTLRENGGTVLPVVDDEGALIGLLTDAGLARALAQASEATDAIGDYLDAAPTLPPYASAAEALRRGMGGEAHVVVDDRHRVVGLVSAVDLWPRRRTLPRPAMVGGLATPFGVYLTSGNVSAGAPWYGLVGSGAATFGMFVAAMLLTTAAGSHGLPAAWELPLSAGVFLLLMRLSPLSGIHGAEHQVVHAIEREESLVPEVVRRMPRVHPRCGTNLVAGFGVFLAIRSIPGIGDAGIVLSAVAALAFAMPLGSILQRFVTTSRPTDRQLAQAIRAGEALLLANATAHRARPTPLRRIWSMGVLQIAAGAMALALIVAFVKRIAHIDWLPELDM